ncbi:uncharacterized protein [Argopecten irradians]|uniref:uncharacterized protein isoform X1 n=1 Tax=Argopecten irradians TaxID=31199 RepID=UPI003719239C
MASSWSAGTPVVQGPTGPISVAMPVLSGSPLTMEMMPSNFVPVGRQVLMFREAGIDGCALEVCAGQFMYIPQHGTQHQQTTYGVQYQQLSQIAQHQQSAHGVQHQNLAQRVQHQQSARGAQHLPSALEPQLAYQIISNPVCDALDFQHRQPCPISSQQHCPPGQVYSGEQDMPSSHQLSTDGRFHPYFNGSTQQRTIHLQPTTPVAPTRIINSHDYNYSRSESENYSMQTFSPYAGYSENYASLQQENEFAPPVPLSREHLQRQTDSPIHPTALQDQAFQQAGDPVEVRSHGAVQNHDLFGESIYQGRSWAQNHSVLPQNQYSVHLHNNMAPQVAPRGYDMAQQVEQQSYSRPPQAESQTYVMAPQAVNPNTGRTPQGHLPNQSMTYLSNSPPYSRFQGNQDSIQSLANNDIETDPNLGYEGSGQSSNGPLQMFDAHRVAELASFHTERIELDADDVDLTEIEEPVPPPSATRHSQNGRYPENGNWIHNVSALWSEAFRWVCLVAGSIISREGIHRQQDSPGTNMGEGRGTADVTAQMTRDNVARGSMISDGATMDGMTTDNVASDRMTTDDDDTERMTRCNLAGDMNRDCAAENFTRNENNLEGADTTGTRTPWEDRPMVPRRVAHSLRILFRQLQARFYEECHHWVYLELTMRNEYQDLVTLLDTIASMLNQSSYIVTHTMLRGFITGSAMAQGRRYHHIAQILQEVEGTREISFREAGLLRIQSFILNQQLSPQRLLRRFCTVIRHTARTMILQRLQPQPSCRLCPGTRRRTRERNILHHNEGSPERRAFQPPNMMGQQIHPAALPPHHQSVQQPVLMDVDRVPVSAPVTMAPYGIPVCTGPHQITMCTAAGHLPVCNSQPTWSIPTCNVQIPASCGVQQIPSCNIQQIPIHPNSIPPMFQPPHSTSHIPQHQLASRPPQFPGSTHQRHEEEVQLISDHRHAYPLQAALHQHHPGATAFTATPPVLLQEPMVHPSPQDIYGPFHRYYARHRTAGRNGRLRSIPPPPPPYPGFLLHFLAMLGNPPLPRFGRDFREDATEVENYEALLNLAERLGDAKPKGLTKLEIDQLPAYRFNKETHHSGMDQTSCVVCMCDFENRQLLRVLPCSHEFHTKCVDKWLKTNRTCPICRADAAEVASQSD